MPGLMNEIWLFLRSKIIVNTRPGLNCFTSSRNKIHN